MTTYAWICQRCATSWIGMKPRPPARCYGDCDRSQQGKPAFKLAPELWPYGFPHMHEECCMLHHGKVDCDCKASDESDTEWGDSHHGTGS
jgi:hypothetical protein